MLAADPGPVRGQILAGRVIDARSGAALAAATVGVLPDGRSLFSASADSLGRFRVPLPRAGRYALSVSRVGYEALTTAAASVGSNQLLELELRLSVDPIELGSLVVTARRSALGAHAAYEQRLEWVSRTGFGHVITCADLEAVQSPFLSSYLARLPRASLATDPSGKTFPVGGIIVVWTRLHRSETTHSRWRWIAGGGAVLAGLLLFIVY